MKFNTRYFLSDREGEEKIVRKFSLLPRAFDRDKKRIWLEMVNIVYKVEKIDVGGSGEWGVYAWKWVPVRYATSKDMLELPVENANADIYDLIEKRVKRPLFWLCLDTVALASIMFDTESGVALLLVIKLLQTFSYYTFNHE